MNRKGKVSVLSGVFVFEVDKGLVVLGKFMSQASVISEEGTPFEKMLL